MLRCETEQTKSYLQYKIYILNLNIIPNAPKGFMKLKSYIENKFLDIKIKQFL